MDDAAAIDGIDTVAGSPPTPSRVDFDRRLLEIAGAQHGLVAHDQLREFGTPRQIEYRLARGRIEHVHEGVYRLAGSPRTWHQQLLAACLASSSANAVSFRAAAQMWGLPGGAEIVEVTAPRHRRMQYDDVTMHESFFLTDLDVTYLHGIPVTRPARVICDLGLLVQRGEMRAGELVLALQDAMPARPRRPPACLARMATARRGAETRRPRHRSPPRQLPAASTQARHHAGAQVAHVAARRGPSRADPAVPRCALDDALGAARLRVAGGEGLLRVRSVQVARGPRQVHARQRPSAPTRGPRLVRRVRHRRRARLRRAPCNTAAAPTPPRAG